MLDLDGELLLVAACLRDIGHDDGASRGGVDGTDADEFAIKLLKPFGWESGRLGRCLNAIERDHKLRSRWEAWTEVEPLRRADLIEVSGGDPPRAFMGDCERDLRWL